MENEITVSRISFEAAELAKQIHPARLDGLDYRSRHLQGTECESRTITNDEWGAPRR
jgi:hypothetical protein